MIALANSLKRVWTAKNRAPDLTGSGTPGFFSKNETTLAGWVYARISELIGVARRTAPTAIVIACNLFR